MRIILYSVLLFHSGMLFCQTPDAKCDFQWLVGYADSVEKTVINLFDFNNLPLSIQPFPITNGKLPLRSGVTIADTSGKIMLYASGCDVYNGQLELLANGDHITPDDWVYNTYCPDYYPFTQSWLLLPDPGQNEQFYLLAIGYHQGTNAGTHAWGAYYSRLSTDAVLEKNTLLCADSLFGSHINACRHANGRDWWLILNKVKTNQYYKYLLSPAGFQFVDLQAIGTPSTWAGSGTGQSAFSPDGTRFIHYENVADMFVFDFDRCSGQLSNFHPVEIAHNEDSGNSLGGMAISPDSRFAYTFGYLYVYQVDLQAQDMQESVLQVAYWDSTYVGPFKTTFGKAALAPDGKIYAAVPGGNPYMHIIHNPDAKGDSCQVEQHGLYMPYSQNTNTMPNFPNFRLGKQAGSACDSLSTTTNTPTAGFDFQIQPNPNNGTFQWIMPVGNIVEYQIEVFDALGRLVWQTTARQDVSIFGIAPGCYFLVCTNLRNGQKFSKSFVVHQ